MLASPSKSCASVRLYVLAVSPAVSTTAKFCGSGSLSKMKACRVRVGCQNWAHNGELLVSRCFSISEGRHCLRGLVVFFGYCWALCSPGGRSVWVVILHTSEFIGNAGCLFRALMDVGAPRLGWPCWGFFQ